MDGELVRLTGTEWAVLECLWEASPQTMTQLAHTLAGREGWAKGTTTTVLKRMTEKGLLTCQQGERAKWYAPAVERRAAVVSETRSFLRRICRESVSMLTNAAAEPERLSREEIAASDSPALPADFLRWLEETPCEPGEITSELFPNPGGGPDLEVTVLAPEESPEERIGCVMAARVPAGSEQTV